MALSLVHWIDFCKNELSLLWNLSPNEASWVLVVVLAAVFGSIHLIVRYQLKRPETQKLLSSKSFLRARDTLRAVHAPMNALMITVVAALLILAGVNPAEDSKWIDWIDHALDIVGFLATFWFFFRIIGIAMNRFQLLTERRASKWEAILLPLIAKALRGTLIVIGFNLCLQAFHLSSTSLLAKLGSILMIGIITWFLIQVTLTFDDLAQIQFDIHQKNNLQARKIHTQVHVIQKILIFFIGLVAVGCTLMLFDAVRKFGTTLLASAGLAGIVLGFAAQQTISNLLAGIQIAITQPIRLDDVVIVEGEWGRIEEISLTYVVVRIWDLRRLILPISYFTSKAFQNWTRISSEILGTIYLYVDYSAPIDAIRSEAERIVQSSPLWDGKTCSMIVADATEKTLQIRVLISAVDSGAAFDLRCLVREKLVEFLQANHPGALPRIRLESSLEKHPGQRV